MVTVKQQLVPDAVIRTKTYGGGNRRTHITIHETGNTAKGANAQSHANLQSRGNSRDASWHYQVDDKQAIQSFNHNISTWQAGDGRGTGNLHSISIEICVNSDGDFKKAVENAAKLTRQIMLQEKIPVQNVVQHNLWSGKNCPANLRSGAKGVNWADFIKLVKDDPKPTPEPKKEVDEMAELLPETQKKDMRKILKDAYTKDKYGNLIMKGNEHMRVFSVDHTSKVDKMTRGQATDLLISYVARTERG